MEPPYFNLSVMLEQQINEIQSLKSLVLAMSATLERLDPKYKTELLKALEGQPKGKDSPDAAALSFAKKTLVELRHSQ
jgi:hypothetical protein